MSNSASDANCATLKLDNHAFGTDYAIRVTAKIAGSNNSNGEIFYQKK